MTEPTFAATWDTWTWTWLAWKIDVQLTRFHEGSRETTAEVQIRALGPKPKVLTRGTMVLNAIRGRELIAQRLTRSAKGPEWLLILERVCYEALDLIRKPPAIESLEPTDADQPTWFVLNPLLYERNQTVIYGPGEAGKSLFALYCACLCSSGCTETPLVCAPDGHHVLYLDWEMTAYEQRARIKQLRAGHPGLKAIPFYRRLTRPLAEHVPELRAEILDKGITILIVDSLGLAAGGELQREEPAMRFESALRALNVSSLVLAHTAKNAENKTIFGSVMFHNYARSVWEICPGEDGDTKRFALHHRKNNLGRRFPILGYELTMRDDMASFQPFDPAEDPQLTQTLPLQDRLKRALRQGVEGTVKVMAAELGETPAYVKKTFNRFRDRPGWWTATNQGGTGQGHETQWMLINAEGQA